jgi:hypothetical protein
VVALALAQPAMAQDKPPAKKKPAAVKQAAHKKATPEQIRKFNELEKKKPTAKK